MVNRTTRSRNTTIEKLVNNQQLHLLRSRKNIAREIDLHCQKSSDYKFLKEFEVKITLIIEVKKSTNPWVFFISESEDPTLQLSFFSLVNYFNIDNSIVEHLFVDFPSQLTQKISTSQTEAFKEYEISNIYKAIDSVTKATYYFHKRDSHARKIQLKEGERADELFEKTDLLKPSILNIYLPVIIYEGTLTEAFLDKNAGFEIRESCHIPYLNHTIIDEEMERLYTIDVVDINYFSTYLQNLESWLNKQTLFLKWKRGA